MSVEPAIYRRDFAQLYNDRWGFFDWKMWPFVARVAVKHNRGARTWLDLCCGAGSLLRLVCKAGLDVTGVDRSPHQLRHARRNAPGAKLVRADVRTFRLPARFDVITCLFDSFNYLLLPRDLERAFRNARRHLDPKGLFIFDMNVLEGYKARWHGAWTVREPRRFAFMESFFDEDRLEGRLLVTGFLREGRLYRKFEEEHVQRAYRPEEIEQALGRAGFQFRKYDGGRLTRPRKKSARLVYVCRAKGR